MMSADATAEAELALCEELQLYCKDNALPFMSAGDLLNRPESSAHHAWLTDFIERWDAVVDPLEAPPHSKPDSLK